jgi:hypothetical protein
MRFRFCVAVGIILCAAITAGAQTAEELVAKNLAAKGGIEKIKSITALRLTGKLDTTDQFTAEVSEERRVPDMLRQAVTVQRMSQIQAYDGGTGWQISPFMGRKDPELMGDDDLRGFVEEADFYGPLVDYQKKGNRIEYLGHATVDGDDAYRLKVTLKNGDYIYYYLDPDTYLEIRTERSVFIRGSVHETAQNLGAYRQVAGVYFPFSLEVGPKNAPALDKITITKIEANVAIPDSEFKMPAAAAAPSPQKHPAPASEKPAPKPPPNPSGSLR